MLIWMLTNALGCIHTWGWHYIINISKDQGEEKSGYRVCISWPWLVASSFGFSSINCCCILLRRFQNHNVDSRQIAELLILFSLIDKARKKYQMQHLNFYIAFIGLTKVFWHSELTQIWNFVFACPANFSCFMKVFVIHDSSMMWKL